jgi:hypothetical protein
MLVSLTELKSYRIECTDGEIGRVDDMMFYRGEWVVRYVVAATEDLDHRPLLDVADVRRIDRHRHVLSMTMSQDDVADARTVDVEQPVDEMNEVAVHRRHCRQPRLRVRRADHSGVRAQPARIL